MFHRAEFDRLDVASHVKLEALGMHMTAPNLAPFKAKSRALYRQFATVLAPISSTKSSAQDKPNGAAPFRRYAG